MKGGISREGVSSPGWSNSGEVLGGTSREMSLLGAGWGMIELGRARSEGTTSGRLSLGGQTTWGGGFGMASVGMTWRPELSAALRLFLRNISRRMVDVEGARVKGIMDEVSQGR